MITETKAIVRRLTETVGGRRMIALLTEDHGKISAGAFSEERNRKKSGLALRPFSLGSYELRKTGENWHINRSEVLNSHYGLGSDVEKYMAACYALELTDKLLPELAKAPELFSLLAQFLDMLEEKSCHCGLLQAAFTLKALQTIGQEPLLGSCTGCGDSSSLIALNPSAGGAWCSACKTSLPNERLIYAPGFDIVGILKFMADQPFARMRRLALDEKALTYIQAYLRAHLSAHLDIGELKSDVGR
jgi:DNA repair protein RecO (recombination protein O)